MPEDVEVVVAGHRRRYLVCPVCSRLVWAVYDRDGDEAWRCRLCLKGPAYRSQFGREPSAIASELRAALGADRALTAPLPPRPRDRKAAARYDAIVSEIVLQETAVLRQLERTIAGLEKYARLRGVKL